MSTDMVLDKLALFNIGISMIVTTRNSHNIDRLFYQYLDIDYVGKIFIDRL